MHHPDESESPAEQMVRELGLDPALSERAEDDPLVQYAREEVAEMTNVDRMVHDVTGDEDAPKR